MQIKEDHEYAPTLMIFSNRGHRKLKPVRLLLGLLSLGGVALIGLEFANYSISLDCQRASNGVFCQRQESRLLGLAQQTDPPVGPIIAVERIPRVRIENPDLLRLTTPSGPVDVELLSTVEQFQMESQLNHFLSSTEHSLNMQQRLGVDQDLLILGALGLGFLVIPLLFSAFEDTDRSLQLRRQQKNGQLWMYPSPRSDQSVLVTEIAKLDLRPGKNPGGKPNFRIDAVMNNGDRHQLCEITGSHQDGEEAVMAIRKFLHLHQ
jgi:hypothetical protein